MKTSILSSFLLIAVLISGNQFCFAQTSNTNVNSQISTLDGKQQKLKSKVEKIGIGGKITVIKFDDKKYFGSVIEINESNFKVQDVDSKSVFDFNFTDLRKIQSGDGERNLVTGKRFNPKKGWLYGLAIIGGLITILVIAASDKDS